MRLATIRQFDPSPRFHVHRRRFRLLRRKSIRKRAYCENILIYDADGTRRLERSTLIGFFLEQDCGMQPFTVPVRSLTNSLYRQIVDNQITTSNQLHQSKAMQNRLYSAKCSLWQQEHRIGLQKIPFWLKVARICALKIPKFNDVLVRTN